MSNKIIGSWVLSNNHVLKVLDIQYGIEDEATVQLNDMVEVIKEIQTDEEGSYIEYIGMKLYFHECMRH